MRSIAREKREKGDSFSWSFFNTSCDFPHAAIELIYPANGNVSLLLANIESVLSRNSFSLMGVDSDKYSDKNVTFTPKVLIPWTMQIVAKGSPSNVVNLLKSLEALPMYPVVESFSFSDQKDSSGLTSFSINLRIYKIDNTNFYR